MCAGRRARINQFEQVALFTQLDELISRADGQEPGQGVLERRRHGGFPFGIFAGKQFSVHCGDVLKVSRRLTPERFQHHRTQNGCSFLLILIGQNALGLLRESSCRNPCQSVPDSENGDCGPESRTREIHPILQYVGRCAVLRDVSRALVFRHGHCQKVDGGVLLVVAEHILHVLFARGLDALVHVVTLEQIVGISSVRRSNHRLFGWLH